jgi:phosphoserine phosphatase
VRGVDLAVDAAGVFDGRVSRHCEPEDKVTFAAEQCRRLGVGLDQVVAIGDGRSDLPLFEAVGFSVALNASATVRAASDVAVESTSLLDALSAVPGLLGPTST